MEILDKCPLRIQAELIAEDGQQSNILVLSDPGQREDKETAPNNKVS